MNRAWILCPLFAFCPDLHAADRGLADRLGCTHASGRYSFTDQDFLSEGADTILATGMRVIKLYLCDSQTHYPFNSQWPKFDNLVETARHRYYRAVFDKPFTTYILTTFVPSPGGGDRWRDGFSDEEYADEKQQFHALTLHLLRTYKGTGKTFILQNWEGDWASRTSTDRDPKYDATETALAGMVRWMEARQEGVSQARRETRDTDVKVYHALEVNLVDLAMQGRPMVTNEVVPKTRCDLYSYSAYDTIGQAGNDFAKGQDLFRRSLDYLAAKAPDSEAFGAKNVYVGEFGWPEVQSEKDPHASTEKSLNVIRMTVETSLDWGCQYVVYWQVFDNESRAGIRRPDNSELRGFYLIKPDGKPAAARDYFVSLLRESTATAPATGR